MLALLFAAALSVSGPARTAVADTAAVVPVQQTLDLELDPAARTWNAELQADLAVRRPVRLLRLALRDAVVSRVEMTDARGKAELLFGSREPGVLAIETRAPLARGRAALAVATSGAWADSGAGARRDGRGGVVLERPAGAVVPAWPALTRPTRWRLDVHVPAGCTVECALPRTSVSRQGAWRTWSFASRAPVDADRLRVTVRPRGTARLR